MLLTAYLIGTAVKIGLSKAKWQPPMGGQLQLLMTVTPVSTVFVAAFPATSTKNINTGFFPTFPHEGTVKLHK